VAQSMPQLIVFRAVQGLGAGGLIPLALTIIGEIYTLAERTRIIAEGAGALALAAALSGRAGSGKVVCIVSGGNINLDKLADILQDTAT